jgi:monofunctional biosynthetic peptidoglycan transglycosylase
MHKINKVIMMNISKFIIMIPATVCIGSLCFAQPTSSVVSTSVARSPEKKRMKTSDLHKTITTFTSPADAAGWQTINDVVMGGVSDSSFKATTNYTAIFSGTVSLENNGGFASVRSPARSINLHDYDGILLRVKGDGKNYKCSLRLDRSFDGINYQTTFTASKNIWKEIRLPFSAFKPTYHGRTLTDRPALDPSKIQTVGFLISDKQEGPFTLEIEWIKAYSDKIDKD